MGFSFEGSGVGVGAAVGFSSAAMGLEGGSAVVSSAL